MSAVPHRFVVPSYYPAGLQPGGQDFLNVVSGGIGGLDGSAWVSPKKVGGPNNGTYFWAWQEDALTGNFNRGLRALGENTDLLDDLLHRPLAIPTRVDGATAGETFVSLAMGSGVFLGIGTPPANVQPDMADYLASFFELVDDKDEEILNPATGDRVRVASLTLDPADTLGGGNFAEKAVIVTFTEAIPVGVKFRLYYAVRGNLATIPVDALTYIKLRGAQEVPADVEQVLRSLHQPDSVGSHTWDAPWRATIWDLTTGGLNERYRHRGNGAKQTPPEDYFGDQGGEDGRGLGAWIRRDGPAVTVYADSDPFGGPHPFSDPLNALLATKFREEYDPLAPTAGAVGIALYGARRNGTDWNGESSYAPGGALMLGLWPHDFDVALSTTTPYTRVTGFGTNNATLSNHGVYNLNTGEAVVELKNTDDYFRKAGNSAVSVGYDLLECTYTISGQPHRKVFTIVGMGETLDLANTKKCRVRCLDGTVPNFQNGYVDADSASVRWISTSFAVGDGAGARHAVLYGNYATPVLLDGLFYQVPPYLSSTAGDNNVPRTAASFSAATNTNSDVALQWGGFSKTLAAPAFGGSLTGSGGIECTDVYVSNTLTVDGGDVEVIDGKLRLQHGDLQVDVGSVLVSAGDLVLTLGGVSARSLTIDGTLDVTLSADSSITTTGTVRTLKFLNKAGLQIGDALVESLATIKRKSSLVIEQDVDTDDTAAILDAAGKILVRATTSYDLGGDPSDGLLAIQIGGHALLDGNVYFRAAGDSVDLGAHIVAGANLRVDKGGTLLAHGGTAHTDGNRGGFIELSDFSELRLDANAQFLAWGETKFKTGSLTILENNADFNAYGRLTVKSTTGTFVVEANGADITGTLKSRSALEFYAARVPVGEDAKQLHRWDNVPLAIGSTAFDPYKADVWILPSDTLDGNELTVFLKDPPLDGYSVGTYSYHMTLIRVLPYGVGTSTGDMVIRRFTGGSKIATFAGGLTGGGPNGPVAFLQMIYLNGRWRAVDKAPFMFFAADEFPW